MKNNIFKFLNWILKIDKNKPDEFGNSIFMVNRWLSMASKPIAKIVNSTTNRWNFQDQNVNLSILHSLVPKYGKRIEYIKKAASESEDDIENLDNLAASMEMSRKELEMYFKSLEEMNLSTK